MYRLSLIEKVILETEDGFIMKHPTLKELRDAKVESYNKIRMILGRDQ